MVLRWSVNGVRKEDGTKMVLMRLENFLFLFLKGKIFASYSYGTWNEDGSS